MICITLKGREAPERIRRLFMFFFFVMVISYLGFNMLFRFINLIALPYLVTATNIERNLEVLRKFDERKECSGTFAVFMSVSLNEFTSVESPRVLGTILSKTLALDAGGLKAAYNSIDPKKFGITSSLPPIQADMDQCAPLNTEHSKFYSMDENYAELLASAIWKVVSSGMPSQGELVEIMVSIMGLFNHDQISVLNLMSQSSPGKDGPICAASTTSVEILDPFKTSGISVTKKVFNHGNFLVPLFTLINQLLVCGGNHLSDKYWKIEDDHAQELERILGQLNSKECSETYSVILAVAVDQFIKKPAEHHRVFSKVLLETKSMPNLAEAYDAIVDSSKPKPSTICNPNDPRLSQFTSIDKPFADLATSVVDKLVNELNKGPDYHENREKKKDALDAIIQMFSSEQQTILVSIAQRVGLETDSCPPPGRVPQTPGEIHNLLVAHFAHIRQLTPCIFVSDPLKGMPSVVVPEDEACSGTFAIVIAVAVDAFLSIKDKTRQFPAFLDEAIEKDAKALNKAYNDISSSPTITSTRSRIDSSGAPRVFCNLKESKSNSFKTMTQFHRLLAKFSISRLLDDATFTGADGKSKMDAALDAIINRFTLEQKKYLKSEVQKLKLSIEACEFSPLQSKDWPRDPTGYLVDLFVYVHRRKVCKTELRDVTLNKLNEIESRKCSDHFAQVVAVATDRFIKAADPQAVQAIWDERRAMNAEHLSKAFRQLQNREMVHAKSLQEKCVPALAWEFVSMDYDDQLIVSESIKKLVDLKNPELLKAALSAIAGSFSKEQTSELETMVESQGGNPACGKETLDTYRPFQGRNYLVPVYLQIKQILKCDIEPPEISSHHLPATVGSASLSVDSESKDVSSDHQSLPLSTQQSTLVAGDETKAAVSPPVDDQSLRLVTVARQQRMLFSNLQRVVFVISQSNLHAVHAAVHLRVLESYIMVVTKALDQFQSLTESKEGIEGKLKDVLSQVSIAIGKVPIACKNFIFHLLFTNHKARTLDTNYSVRRRCGDGATEVTIIAGFQADSVPRWREQFITFA